MARGRGGRRRAHLGSVAREVARQLGPRDDVVGVAIGDPTARAARDVGLRLDAVAERPTDAALAAALVGALAATRTTAGSAALPDDPAAPRPPARPASTRPRRRPLVTHQLPSGTTGRAACARARACVGSSARRACTRPTSCSPVRQEGLDAPRPISSMPGVVQHTEATLADAVRDAARAGVGGVMLFGIPAERDATGTQADAEDGILQRGIRIAVEAAREDAVGGPVVMADTCLDEFTDHGHCGVLAEDATGASSSTTTRRSTATPRRPSRRRGRARTSSRRRA